MPKEQNERRVPKLRFKGFTDDWMQEKLGERFDIVTGGTPSRKNNNYWNPKEIPWLSSGEINKKRIYETDDMISKNGFENSSAKLVPANSILIALAGQGKTRGSVAISYIDTTTNQSLAAFVSEINNKNNFLYFSLERKYDRLRAVSSGDGTRGGLNKKLLSNFEVYFPKLAEQNKISELLNKLDYIITLEQEKIEALNLFKLYLINNLYAYESNYPIIRFSGFDKPWNSQKIQEIANTFSGGTPRVTNSDYYGGKIPFIRSAEINKTQTEIKLTKKGVANSSAKKVSKGDILYALYGATSGEVGISKINGVINQAILAIIPNDSIDTYFLSNLLEFNKDRIINKYLQGGQGNLSAHIINNLIFLFPSKEEQKLVGETLRKAGDTIQFEQMKLEKYKKIKKKLLSSLFV